MTDDQSFPVGIEFDSVLAAISKQIYETPLAFIRENVQNAVDALRLQAARKNILSSDPSLSVRINAEPETCDITDNGVGMSLEDLRNLFWTIGASGKRTLEARAAGCVGMFGIGGFANFGVCDELRVISQAAGEPIGHWTQLSRSDIEHAMGGIPKVSSGQDDEMAPRGTRVRGVLRSAIDPVALQAFVRDFVQFAEEHVFYNGELISRRPFKLPSDREADMTPITSSDRIWSVGEVELTGRLFETPGHLLQSELTALKVGSEPVRLRGWLRFENGTIEVLKRGFKLCSTTIGTDIGVSGVIDCDLLSPTAGRDSLDPESSSLLSSLVTSMEQAAIAAVLESPDRIRQNARIFRYVRRHGMVGQLGNVVVELADGTESSLKDIQQLAQNGARVFYATRENKALSQLLQTRGHVVVQLAGDNDRQAAVRDYLTTLCGGDAFDGRIECAELYATLSTFERSFLSEVELTIKSAYDVSDLQLIAGSLTEDVPVFAVGDVGKQLKIYVDVRHSEITKLQQLGIGGIFYSLVAAFVREYLGNALRSRSPKFFGSGAVNLDFLAKRKSELWILATDDVAILRRGSQREVVTEADVQVVRAGGGGGIVPADQVAQEGKRPKLVRIEGEAEFDNLTGYYLRIPKTAAYAYGDVIQQCEGQAAVWAGNKIMLIASDLISTAFEFEVRLDRLITDDGPSGAIANGALDLAQRPIQSLFDGLYFPIPATLEAYLVPPPGGEVRIEVTCSWIDFSAARAWQPPEE